MNTGLKNINTLNKRVNKSDRARAAQRKLPSLTWQTAYDRAIQMLEQTDIEPTSAFKQAGADMGIEFGDSMGEFVSWARGQYVEGWE